MNRHINVITILSTNYYCEHTGIPLFNLGAVSFKVTSHQRVQKEMQVTDDEIATYRLYLGFLDGGGLEGLSFNLEMVIFIVAGHFVFLFDMRSFDVELEDLGRVL